MAAAAGDNGGAGFVAAPVPAHLARGPGAPALAPVHTVAAPAPVHPAARGFPANVNVAAALALAALHPKDQSALSTLLDLVVKDPDYHVRIFGAYAVVRLESGRTTWAAEQLARIVADTKLDADLRALAATTLGGLKAKSPEARQALEKAAQDPSDKVSAAAADALKELGH